MKKMGILFLLMLGYVAIPAMAGYTTGQDLYTDLKKYDSRDWDRGDDRARDVAIAIAFGYVTGVADSFGKQSSCIPQGVTVGQLSQTVLNYLSKHPEYWNIDASFSVRLALVEQWPCPKK